MISSRMAVAVHILSYLALRAGEVVPSPELAESVNTHPVVVRRILGRLRSAGLVRVHTGVSGGAALGRPPEKISLLAVYRAVETKRLFSSHPQPPCGRCRVGANIAPVLDAAFRDVEAAMEAALEAVTLARVCRALVERQRRDGSASR